MLTSYAVGLPKLDLTRHLVRPRRPVRDRLLTYGALAAALILLGVAVERLRRPVPALADQTWTAVDYASLPEVRLLREYVRIDTSSREIEGAEFLAGVLSEAGIPVHLERLGDGHANLWAVLEGEDPRAVVLHHHIDVDPADPAQWDYPPFGAEIDLPWLYGRGVFDMKSVAIAQLMAFLDLKRGGRPLARSVIFLATATEERGSELGTRWILAHHPQLVARFGAVLTEGGVVEATSVSEVKYWGIEFAQKRFGEVLVCSGDRARLEELREELLADGSPPLAAALTPEVGAFLTAYAASRDRPEYRRALADPRQILADPRTFRRLPPYLKSLFRNEAVPFPVAPDPGAGYRLRIAFHLLPGADFEEVRRQLVPEWRLHGLPWTVAAAAGADHGSPLDHPVFRELAEVVGERYPGTAVGPYFVPWSATDARFFRAAGIPAYGFSPFLILTTDTLQMSAANERMALPGFVRGVDLYVELLRRLAT